MKSINWNTEKSVALKSSRRVPLSKRLLSFFEQTEDLIITGPTGTNVMEITAFMIS